MRAFTRTTRLIHIFITLTLTLTLTLHALRALYIHTFDCATLLLRLPPYPHPNTLPLHSKVVATIVDHKRHDPEVNGGAVPQYIKKDRTCVVS